MKLTTQQRQDIKELAIKQMQRNISDPFEATLRAVTMYMASNNMLLIKRTDFEAAVISGIAIKEIADQID